MPGVSSFVDFQTAVVGLLDVNGSVQRNDPLSHLIFLVAKISLKLVTKLSINTEIVL